MNVDKWARCGQFLLIMDLMRSLCYIGLRMGHVIVYCAGWVLDRAPCTKETLFNFY